MFMAHTQNGKDICNYFMVYLKQKILFFSCCPVDPCLGNYFAFKMKGNNLRGTVTSFYNLEFSGTNS